MKIERWTSILIYGLPIISNMAKVWLILIYLISSAAFMDFGFTAIFFWTLLRNNFVVDKNINMRYVHMHNEIGFHQHSRICTKI